MLDRSSSMAGSNFAIAESGVNSFVTDSAASGIDFAIQYFGLSNFNCSGSAYSIPEVGFGTLPGLASAVSNSLAATSIGVYTLLEGALNGGKTAGTQYLASKTTAQFDLVLATDTGPGGGGPCTNALSVLTAIVASAWPAVATHFIGLPGHDAQYLTPIAAAGGTVASISASTSSAVKAAMLRAVTPCRFAIPAPGTPSYTLSLGVTTVPLTKQANATACGSGDGWFEYASSAVLCPTSCQKVGATTGGKVVVATCP